jgi:hypothetical protein
VIVILYLYKLSLSTGTIDAHLCTPLMFVFIHANDKGVHFTRISLKIYASTLWHAGELYSLPAFFKLTSCIISRLEHAHIQPVILLSCCESILLFPAQGLSLLQPCIHACL